MLGHGVFEWRELVVKKPKKMRAEHGQPDDGRNPRRARALLALIFERITEVGMPGQV